MIYVYEPLFLPSVSVKGYVWLIVCLNGPKGRLRAQNTPLGTPIGRIWARIAFVFALGAFKSMSMYEHFVDECVCVCVFV